MTSSCNSEVENTLERFSHRSSTSKKSLLSSVARIQLCFKKIVEFQMVQHIDQIVSVESRCETASTSSAN